MCGCEAARDDGIKAGCEAVKLGIVKMLRRISTPLALSDVNVFAGAMTKTTTCQASFVHGKKLSRCLGMETRRNFQCHASFIAAFKRDEEENSMG